MGGVECSYSKAISSSNYAYPTQIACTLDDADILDPDTPYDVVIATDEGSSVIPQAVAFTSQPTLSHVLRCWEDGGFYPYFAFPVPRCMAGDTMSIVGRRLLRGGLQLNNVAFETYYAPPTPYINCSNAQVVSDILLTCVMQPNTDKDYIMRTSKLLARWQGAYQGNIVMTYPYDFLDAPRILSIKGCGMTATDPQTLFLTSCEPGDSLQLSGYNLNVTGAVIRSIRHVSTNYTLFACADVQVWNDSLVSCTLPTLDEFPALANLSQYNVTLFRDPSRPAEFTSNYFAVTFGSQPVQPGETGAAASSSRTAGTVVAVVVPVVVLVFSLAVLGWWLRKRRYEGRYEAQAWWSTNRKRGIDGVELADK